MPTQIESEYHELTKRAFKEMLARVGVPIVGNGTIKMCIAAPIKEARHQELIGASHQYETHIDMLAEDFDAFFAVLNVTEVTVDEITMTIVSIDRDPQDPTVHFEARRDY